MTYVHDGAGRYGPIGFCIYCGKTAADLPAGEVLSSEHIIPEGIGAELELLGASCPDCRDTTSAFERECLRKLFGPARAFYGIYGSRHKKERATTWPVQLKSPGGIFTQSVDVPLAQYPFGMGMFVLPPAGMLVGRPRDAGYAFESRFKVIQDPRADAFAAAITAADPWHRRVLVVHDIPLGDFCKQLAKIAHSFAIASLGPHGFEPFLREAIIAPRDDARAAPHFVGGATWADNTPIDTMWRGSTWHELRLLRQPFEGQSLLVVRVQLFAPLGTPVYDVVAGSLGLPA